MRDFFILWMERIINVVIVIGAIAVVISGFVAMFSAQGGFLQGLIVWVIGAFYLVLMGGMIYLGLGIYNNTRRTAEAIEQLNARS
ncbi:hypothetical protein [Paracoccus alkanivorans]|uniref:DUF4282 domain-containing protein n=1 Tax=Paracoccus alkanivorans TaxID=2116655 RepID=A0A3M0MK70_9RHOB|nr:hypothetical protein [Paracoccus alkanivorans]RMC37463.1 hypothetical protein C9E81_01545 [Paracoccus alkanivorans]